MRIFVLPVLLFSLVSLPLAGCERGNFHKDEHLKNTLKENKKSYLIVVNKVLKDKIYRLEIMSDGQLSILPETVRVDSISGMKELLEDELGVDLVNTISADDSIDKTNEISFFYYRGGFVFSGENKGISYVVDESNIEIVDQLDVVDKNDKSIHGKRLYKFMAPHWYIFYEYFP